MTHDEAIEYEMAALRDQCERLKVELIAAEAREKALRAITGEMWNEVSADRALMAGYELAVDEWDRRAEAIR